MVTPPVIPPKPTPDQELVKIRRDVAVIADIAKVRLLCAVIGWGALLFWLFNRFG